MGPVLPYLRDPLGFMLNNYRSYGDVVRINMMGYTGAALHGVGSTLFSMDLGGAARELGEAVATLVYAISNPVTLGFARLPLDVPPVGKGRTLRQGLARLDRVLRDIIERHEREGKDTGD